MKISAPVQKWLDETIAQAGPGQFLPPDHELSKMFGVSHSTVRRVYKEYVEAGKIVRIRGKGTCTPSQARPLRDLPLTMSTEDRIVLFIKNEIFSGALKTGDPLPMRKQLCLQFGVTASTVSKAYRRLERDKLIMRLGQRYWVGHFRQLQNNANNSEMLVFYEYPGDLEYLFTQALEHEAFRKMERVLQQAGFKIRYEQYAEFENIINSMAANKQYPYGMLFIRPDQSDYPKINKVCEKYLFKYSSPSILFWGPYLDNISPRFKQMATGSVATAIARKAADFIIQNQYESAAFFYDADSLGAAEFGLNIRLHTEIMHRAPELNMVHLLGPTTSFDTRNSIEKFLAGRTGNLNWAEGLLSKYAPVKISSFVDTIKTFSDFNRSMHENTDKELWLFSRDSDADLALQWCRKNRIEVPKSISLMAFQNDPKYYQSGISTCVADWDTNGYQMAHALLDDIPLEKTRRGLIRTLALVYRRQTTR